MGAAPRRWTSIQRWLLLAAGWQVVGLLATVILSLGTGGFHHLVHWLIIGATFTNGVALLGGAFHASYVRWWQVPLGRRLWRVLVVALGWAAVVALSTLAAIRIGRPVCGADGFEVDHWHLLVVVVNLSLLIVLGLSATLFVVHDHLSLALVRRIQENERLQKLQVETRLAALQAKVNPHFLFNTLNTMLDLVHKDPDKVERAILSLSDIYRRVLALPESEGVPLAEELTLVEHYLEIEKIRMGARLSYAIDLPGDLRSALVPPLAVEILVENAVRHGLARRKEGGSVEVEVRRQEGAVRIEVVDDGVGFDGSVGGTGFGILSVRQRLALLHGGAGKLEVGPGPQGGTRAVLEVPLAN